LRSLIPPPYLNRVARRRGVVLGLLAAVLLVLPATAARAASTFLIQGGGSGHGIGMSQYGAYGYALHGKDYRFILAHYYTGTALGTTNPSRIVRVLLATGRAAFSGAGGAGAGTTTLQPAATYQVTVAGANTLKIVAANGRQLGPTFSSPLTVTGPAPLQVPGLGTYRGALQFRPDGHGGVETVDAVGLDDYVRGVVAAEMPSSWAAQALEAQAVAARTYAITTTVGGTGFDLYDDTRSQMYGGVGAETAATDAAVTATSGQIVTYNGRPAVTYFFSSSGGYTENIENVWTGATPEPWLKGVPDPYDSVGHDPYHHWSLQLSLAAAAAKLGALVKGSLVGITVTAHGASPRILQAAVVGTRGRTAVTGATLQSLFGLATTNATFATISTSPRTAGLSGSVYPAPLIGTIAVQLASGSSWQTVARPALAASGAFTAGGLTPGRYRISSGSLSGPTITVH
jgi:stage II sporulation protein D